MDLALRTVLGPEVMGVLCVVTVSTASIVVVWRCVLPLKQLKAP